MSTKGIEVKVGQVWECNGWLVEVYRATPKSRIAVKIVAGALIGASLSYSAARLNRDFKLITDAP